MPKLLQNLKIREVSSVNRGAGKGVKVMLMKMREGVAPHTPAINETLDKSIQKMFEVSAQHGVPPENVAKARRALGASIAEVEKNVAAEDQQTAIEKSLSQCVDYLTGLVPVAKAEAFLAAVSAFTPAKDSGMTPEQIAKAIADAIAPLQKSLADSTALVTKQAEEISVLKMSKEHQDYIASVDDAEVRKQFFAAADEAAREAVVKEFPPKKAKGKKVMDTDVADADGADALKKEIAKALETSPVIKALKEENVELKKQLGVTTDAAAIATFAKKATDLGLPEAAGEVMRKAYSGDAASQTKLDEMIKGLVNQQDTAVIFKEFGNGGGATGTTAIEIAKARAVEFQKADPKLSRQQAMAKVWSSDHELFQRQKSEEQEARRRAA